MEWAPALKKRLPSKTEAGRILLAFALMVALLPSTTRPARAARSEEPVPLRYTRPELEARWRSRIQSFLDKGTVPLIDLESSLKQEDAEAYLEEALPVMDELGIALIAFDGRGVRGKRKKKVYRWSYYIQEIVNAHPGRFILATNGGTNRNWLNRRGGGPKDYIDQLERQVRSGAYPVMGEIEYRHYMSGRQCKKGNTRRDVDIPLNGKNGRRVFRLSAETGVPFVIHLEPEDAALEALEEMLKAHPKARVIAAHFGQIRHPERESRFGPKLVRRLLGTYPNLYYEISTGEPGRTYRCNDFKLDTVIWEDGFLGSQKDTLKPEYKAILTEFSHRFVAGIDYGGGRGPLDSFLRKRAENIRRILRHLPPEAKHNIGYRNAWKLLTGRSWVATTRAGGAGSAGGQAPRAPTPARTRAPAPEKPPHYTGMISDGHGHVSGKNTDPEAFIPAMDRNNVDRVVIWAKSKREEKDERVLAFQAEHPGRVVAGASFQNQDWREQRRNFIEEIRRKAASGDFFWLGEVSFRGKIGGALNAPPESPLWLEVMKIASENALPITIHHNPYLKEGDAFRRTDEYDRLIETFARNPGANIVWAHWCGLAPAGDVRKLLERVPNLYCDLAWLHKNQRRLPNPWWIGNTGSCPPGKNSLKIFRTGFWRGST